MKKVIVGITGSIAAFKAIQLISDLTKKDYDIEVLMTPSANRFVTVESIQALTKKKVYIDVFDDDPDTITHVDIVKNADLFIVVPASATTIAKLANGIADNMLTAAYLAATCTKMIAPAMNVHMYENVVTQRNLKQLKEDGAILIEPGVGLLACGDVGKGKLASLETLEYMIDYGVSSHPLDEKKVLVTAGPTQEDIDPVRFITNHSSGKMGYSIADAAYKLGAEVKVISGPVSIKNEVLDIDFIRSADELHQRVMSIYKDYDYIIMTAAVGDYKAQVIADNKIKKDEDTLTLTFNKNVDILKELGQNKGNHQVIIGFAMETQDLIDNAKKKLESKNVDMIVANNLKEKGAGFNTDTNKVTFITKDSIEQLDLMSKEEVAYQILKKCEEFK